MRLGIAHLARALANLAVALEEVVKHYSFRGIGHAKGCQVRFHAITRPIHYRGKKQFSRERVSAISPAQWEVVFENFYQTRGQRQRRDASICHERQTLLEQGTSPRGQTAFSFTLTWLFFARCK